MSYTVEYTTNQLNPEWDSFVDRVDGTIFQTTVMSSALNEIDKTDYHCIAVRESENRQIVAGCIVSVFRYPYYGKVGYVWRGPCFANHSDELVGVLTAEIKKFRKTHALSYIVAALNYHNNSLQGKFLSSGFSPKNRNLPPVTLICGYEATLLLDLKPLYRRYFQPDEQ